MTASLPSQRTTGNAYRGLGKNGLERFSTWFTVPEGAPRWLSPSDIDGMLNDDRTDRSLMLEFKPDGVDFPTGQVRTARSLSRTLTRQGRPAWEVLHVSDPWAEGDLGDGYRLADDEVVRVRWYHRGSLRRDAPWTISRLNKFIATWLLDDDPICDCCPRPPEKGSDW